MFHHFVSKLDFHEKWVQFRSASIDFSQISASRSSKYAMSKNVSGAYHLDMAREVPLLRKVWPQDFGKSWKSIRFTKGKPIVTQSGNRRSHLLEWAGKYWKFIEKIIFTKKTYFFWASTNRWRSAFAVFSGPIPVVLRSQNRDFRPNSSKFFEIWRASN